MKAKFNFLKLLTGALLLSSTSAVAKDQVLIMTIGNYSEKPLDGVKYDEVNAKKLASALGFDTTNAILAKNSELTSVGLRNTWDKFSNSVESGDRVFIYYSGHGASQLSPDNTCTQSIVAQDAFTNPEAGLVTTTELSGYVDRIKSKVSDAIVIFDSCFSGGHKELAVARSAGKVKKSGLSSKAWVPKSGEKCDVASNRISKAFTSSKVTARGMKNAEYNFTLIGASSDREEALDNPQAGGLATLGLLQCAEGGVADSNSNGSVDYAELVKCAQQYVNQQVPMLTDQYVPPVIQLDGNKLKPSTIAPTSVSSASQDRAGQVVASFKTFEAGSNFNWGFSVEPSLNSVKIGQDFNIRFNSDHPGYAYLLYVGSDRKEMMQVWPESGQHVQVKAGENITPTLEMQGPAGENVVLMVVSQTPMNFDSMFNKDGVVSINNQSLTDLNCLGQQQRNIKLKDSSGCGSSSKRNIALKNNRPSLGNMAGYAARMISIMGN